MAKSIPDKTVSDVRFFWSEIMAGTFDQKTIAGLLLTIRSFIAAGSPTREIADFVAHCEKDRGHIHDHFEGLRFLVDGQETSPIVIGAETRNLAIFMPTPLRHTCFTDDLQQCVEQLKILDQVEIDEAFQTKTDEMNLCYLSILHYAKLIVKGKPDAEIRASWVLGFGGPDTYLSLRWVREGTNQLIMGTRLRPFDWCDFNPLELDKTASVRAIRGQDGLKLRKV